MALRDHWQGHRRKTRRVIEAFPVEALFNYSVGGMRRSLGIEPPAFYDRS